MEFIGPRVDYNWPRSARAITISPQADKFHTALLIMLLLKYVPIFLGHFASFPHNFRNIRLLDKILLGIWSLAYENYFQTYPTAKK